MIITILGKTKIIKKDQLLGAMAVRQHVIQPLTLRSSSHGLNPTSYLASLLLRALSSHRPFRFPAYKVGPSHHLARFSWKSPCYPRVPPLIAADSLCVVSNYLSRLSTPPLSMLILSDGTLLSPTPSSTRVSESDVQTKIRLSSIANHFTSSSQMCFSTVHVFQTPSHGSASHPIHIH